MVKKSKRREWTAEDVRELKQFAKAKTPAAQIARKLKRTEGATCRKALTLNLSLDSRMTKPKRAFKKASAQKKAAVKEICSKEDGREEKGLTFPGIKLIHVGARHPRA